MALVTKAAVDAQIVESQGNVEKIINLCGIGGAVDRRISQQIEILKNREKAFLRGFNCQSFEELNQKLRELQQAEPLIRNLSGEALSRTFLNSARQYMYKTGQLGGKDAELEKIKEQFIINVLRELNSAEKRIATPKINQTVKDIVFSLLHDLGSGVSLRSSSGLGGSIRFKGGNIEEVLEQIVMSELTPIAEQRMEEFNNKYSNSFSLTTTSDTILITSTKQNLASITQGLLEKQVEKMLNENKMTQSQFQQIQTDVINYILARGPRDPIFESTVREILTSAGTHIFFGKNLINGYTGLLGEIQATYYAKKLGFNAKRKMAATWKGGDRSEGWEPSEDIMLQFGKSKRGLQVKNTAKDMINPINFSDKTLKNLDFSSLGIPGLNADTSSLLEPIYEMHGFNITAEKQEDGKWRPGPNAEFAPSRSDIEDLYNKANRAIAMLAASLMKMSVGRSGAEGNVAYLVAGQDFISASATLQQILGEINSGNFNNFQISSYFSKKGAGQGTIVDFYNSHNSNTIPRSVKIRSSYQFNT